MAPKICAATLEASWDCPIESVSIAGNGSWSNVPLCPGETVALSLLVRTRNGVIADLIDARIEWKTGDSGIAEVFGNGRVLGRKPGVTRVTATVARAETVCTGFVYAIVGE